MNRAAQALGRLAAGKPKRFSAAELRKRSARMKALNVLRKQNAERKKVAAVGAKTSCPKRKKSNDRTHEQNPNKPS
jgi:hypothetical protein